MKMKFYIRLLGIKAAIENNMISKECVKVEITLEYGRRYGLSDLTDLLEDNMIVLTSTRKYFENNTTFSEFVVFKNMEDTIKYIKDVNREGMCVYLLKHEDYTMPKNDYFMFILTFQDNK